MSEIIATWEMLHKRWGWDSVRKIETISIPAGRENVVVEIKEGKGGVVYPCSAEFTQPLMGIRIKTDNLDTEFEFSAENLYNRGEIRPNKSFYVAYYGVDRYVVSFNNHLAYQKEMVLSIFNAGTESGDVTFRNFLWAKVLAPLAETPKVR